MILRNYKLDNNIIQNEKLINLVGTSFTTKQFYSNEYDREYDVFVIESGFKKIVLKKTECQYEVNSYKLLKSKTSNIVPTVYFVEKEEKNLWIAMEYIEENKITLDMKNTELLVKKLAYIHSIFGRDENDISELRKWEKRQDDECDKLVDNDITQKHIDFIKKSQNILSNSKKTFIHGDMIPLNVIASHDDIKIIDWEYGQSGPYILDIGRLLGDYNKTKLWINEKWEKDLLKSYYDSLDKECHRLTYKQFLLDYQCARLDNYFGIVRAFKLRNWDRTEWYDLNLEKMKTSIQKLEILLNDNV
jgi:5-methylthioribose kinase